MDTEQKTRTWRMSGRTVLITGGGKGIGRAISLELAREGADIAVLAARDLVQAEAVAAEARTLGVRAMALVADIADDAAISAAVAKVAETFGQLDVLVNNAGASGRAPLLELTAEDWDRVFAVNARGAFLAGRAAARQMVAQGGGGAIVNIAGASAHRCYPGAGGYGPSKAAVVSLTQQMAVEWARHGIRVNGVSPGPIRESGTGWEEREPALAAEVRKIPLQRAGEPWEVARAVVYLASADGGYVNGQMLILDGGSVTTWYISG
ncbi:MAG TPA: SDR family oxidoreductase [Acidisoma sp.]|jgi:NAD(P)-dependent dehydrogenase (short-subunit alcohol dehydrogenase family)|uniref:SDR family NAD(P)-dependent oxidoreductase n=1 Tax=Acidisoma sp. TaxID=1872115 RepID=UPI002C872B9C|nr:SDR family oxidoreductase [Acidisoma sp.]HTI00725.1 SDR family oxidoreductase [Acidisoma sp.]